MGQFLSFFLYFLQVTPRFFRHFSMVCVQPPSDQCLRTIFGGILGGFLQLFPTECKAFLKPVVDSTIEVYMRISQELLPTPAKSHYTFNLRDVSKVFQVSSINITLSKLIVLRWFLTSRVAGNSDGETS